MNNTFINSKQIWIFPCANRTVNLESKLLTEFNFTHIASLAGAESYVLNDTTTDDTYVYCVVGGYYIKFPKSLIGGETNVYVHLAQISKALVSENNSITETTTVIGSYSSSSNTIIESTDLDSETDSNGNQLFSGLVLSNSDTITVTEGSFKVLPLMQEGEYVNIAPISTKQIQDLAVTTEKIADNAVIKDKLGSDLINTNSATANGITVSLSQSEEDQGFEIGIASDSVDQATDSVYAAHIGTSTSHPSIGNEHKPVYVNEEGVITQVSDALNVSISGNATTADKLNNDLTIDLNGTGYIYNGSSPTEVQFYAPTSAGTNGYILSSRGASGPTWAGPSTLTVGKAGSLTPGATISLSGPISATGVTFNGSTGITLETTIGSEAITNDNIEDETIQSEKLATISGLTANSYGPTTSLTGSAGYKQAFSIPYFTVNEKGLLTAAGSCGFRFPYSSTAYCTTAAGTAAKQAYQGLYNYVENSYILVTFAYTNTATATPITLTINDSSSTTKPLYLNNTIAGGTNYNIPAGTYLVYCNENGYYINTDGNLIVGENIIDSAGASKYLSTDSISYDSSNGILTIDF